MKKTFKRIAAVLTAAVIAASLSGCVDNGYIMTVDGMQIRNGVYLSLQQTSIGLANDKLAEAEGNTDEDTSSDASSETSSDASSDTTSEAKEDKNAVFKKTIDGKLYSDWIIDDTRAGVMRFVGIQRECEKNGISLSDEEVAEITKTVEEEWEDTTISYYGLGFATWGEYYESLGIGLDSMKELSLVDKLNEKLFLHYYDKGGEWAVSDEDFQKAANESYAGYNLITLKYVDYKGDTLATSDEMQEVKDRAKSYADRFNNGESLIDIMYDHNLLVAQNDARKNAEESYSEEKAEGLTKEEYIDKAVKEASVEKAEDEKEFDEFISKKDSVLSDELTDFIFGLPTDGKAYVYEGSTSAYFVIRKPVTDLENWENYYRSDVLREMKGDEFDSRMDIICQNYDVVQNDYLVNTKYSPKKIINKKK